MGSLNTQADYEAALKAVRPFFENEPERGTPEAAEFDSLVAMIEDYEALNYRFDPSKYIEAPEAAQAYLDDALATGHADVIADAVDVVLPRARFRARSS